MGPPAVPDVPQLYLTAPRTRLLAVERVELEPGESRRVTLAAEPRMLARFRDGRWVIDEGEHHVSLATSAETPVLTGHVVLAGRAFGSV
jgi:beta-glucosidase